MSQQLESERKILGKKLTRKLLTRHNGNNLRINNLQFKNQIESNCLHSVVMINSLLLKVTMKETLI